LISLSCLCTFKFAVSNIDFARFKQSPASDGKKNRAAAPSKGYYSLECLQCMLPFALAHVASLRNPHARSTAPKRGAKRSLFQTPSKDEALSGLEDTSPPEEAPVVSSLVL
jgi:hypothetical protein